jgi:hypothetical protein
MAIGITEEHRAPAAPARGRTGRDAPVAGARRVLDGATEDTAAPPAGPAGRVPGPPRDPSPPEK